MKKIIFSIIVLLIGFALLLGFTSPNKVTLPVYLAVFAIIYLFCTLVLLIIFQLAYSNMLISKKIFISTVLAFCPVILLALNTLSTISLLDVLLAFGVPLLIVWYGFKRGF
jgi:hypothetical protein